PVLALVVGAELPAEIVGALVLRVLKVVLSVCRGLPDVEDGARNWLAGEEVGNSAVHQTDTPFRVRVLDDRGAELTEGGVGGPEGAEDGGGGGFDIALGDDLVGNLVY